MLKKIPALTSIGHKIRELLSFKQKSFPGSEAYWQKRYAAGGNSGSGSYNKLAEFKAEIINGFVNQNEIGTVIEYGCGDGNQLALADYESYTGYDVSPKAIEICREKFKHDKKKKFRVINEYRGETADLALSLDVIYHLVEDDIYHSYMQTLFQSSERFVIVYSSDYDEEQRYHERRRKFTDWVVENASNWELLHHIPNKYPWDGVNEEGSLASFYIYRKC